MWNNKIQWEGFYPGNWQEAIDVRSFIQKNYTLYEGSEDFLQGPTVRTQKVWGRCQELLLEELKRGVLDLETRRVSGIGNFNPGYIDRENEVIVGLQTDAPLKRMVNLYGGSRTAKAAMSQYGYALDPEIDRHFSEYRKTHNQGVFDAYPKRTRLGAACWAAYRTSGCIRKRAHHRRLSPRSLIWYGSADTRKKTGSGILGRPYDRRADSPSGRGL